MEWRSFDGIHCCFRCGLCRDWIWCLLTTPIPESVSIQPSILADVKEIETWIFRLLSAPVPVPGKTKLQVRLARLS